MRQFLVCKMALVATLLLLTNTMGQEKQGRVPPEEIEKLVKQLGSDNAKAREAATKALLAIGSDALPHLEVATKAAENLELKRRTEGLYEEIWAKAPDPKLPEGVILVKLPPGEVRMENVNRDGKPVLRVSVGKTTVETQALFFGDRYGATQYQARKDGIHWMTANGGSTQFGLTIVSQPGSATFEEAFLTLEKLKAGSVFVTTPSLVFRWGKDAIPRKK